MFEKTGGRLYRFSAADGVGGWRAVQEVLWKLGTELGMWHIAWYKTDYSSDLAQSNIDLLVKM